MHIDKIKVIQGAGNSLFQSDWKIKATVLIKLVFSSFIAEF